MKSFIATCAVSIAITLLLVQGISQFATASPGVCTRSLSSRKSETYTTTVYYSTNVGYSYKCGWLRRCRATRSVQKTRHEQRTRYIRTYYPQDYCCSGYSGSPPNCRRVCPYLSNPTNGRVSINTYYVGGRATYSCNSGYGLSGTLTRTCLSSGRWSGSSPSCPLVCPSPNRPSNGYVSVTSPYIVGRSAYFYCNSGYRRSGSSSGTCLSSRLWSASQPTCIRVCPYLGRPTNGRVSVNTYDVGGRATFYCNSRYGLSGSSSRTCLSTGSWSGSSPSCPLVCPSPSHPSNGYFSATSPYIVGRYAYFYCYSGYRLSGSSRRTCQSSRLWSNSQPTCIRVCPYLSRPTNGRVSITTHDVGGRATFSCNSGYGLSGSSSRTCLSTGSWSGSSPSCPLVCPSPSRPSNGYVSATSPYIVGRSAYFYCNSGYRRSGSSSRTCQSSRQWSGSQPTCIRVCPTLSSPTNGYVSVTTYDVGGRVTYSCNSGYGLLGSSSLSCLSNGRWSGSLPTCKTVCPPLSRPLYGYVSVSSYFVDVRAIFRCYSGYGISSGSTARTCQSSRLWSGSQPTCTRKCSPLSSPAHGAVTVNSLFLNGVARYSCYDGYMLVGSSSCTCLSTGRWSSFPPTCNPVCPDLHNQTNGALSVSSYFVGGVASYVCDPGFGLDGSPRRTCQSNQKWSGTEPTCKIVCQNLRDPNNGRVAISSFFVGGTATYTCNSDYGIDGSSTRVCSSNRRWTGSEPSCIRECPSLSNPDNGAVSINQESRLLGGIARFSCDPGYELVGTPSCTCQSTGSWSSSPPTCDPVCPDLHDPTNGGVSVSSYSVGGIASYNCNEGYELDGSRSRTCKSDQTWSGVQPTCGALDCHRLSNPNNGLVTVESYNVGGRATYTCHSGYTLQGPATRSCLQSGHWSDSEPSCPRIQCEALTHPVNGHVTYDSLLAGSTATYECARGYTLVGSSSRRCQNDGGWSGLSPTCRAINCGHLIAPFNGRVTVSSTSYGGFAQYICNSGFTIFGSHVRSCQDNEEWSGVAPTCIPGPVTVTCPELDEPNNGDISYSDSQSVRSVATYSCSTGYYLAGPRSTRTCQQDGTWSGIESDYKCEVVRCPYLNSPDNGEVDDGNRAVGGTATYSCSSGYELVDSSGEAMGSGNVYTRSCELLATGDSASWSGKDALCQERISGCPELPEPSVGDLTVTSNNIGGTATYSCPRKYKLKGPSQRLCQGDGTWSGDTPICEPVLCPVPDSPTNGNVVAPNRRVGKFATYSCNPGYTLEGSARRKCRQNGKWKGSMPTCVQEEIEDDPACDLACQNGGTCKTKIKNGKTRKVCNCPSGFTGKLCEM